MPLSRPGSPRRESVPDPSGALMSPPTKKRRRDRGPAPPFGGCMPKPEWRSGRRGSSRRARRDRVVVVVVGRSKEKDQPGDGETPPGVHFKRRPKRKRLGCVSREGRESGEAQKQDAVEPLSGGARWGVVRWRSGVEWSVLRSTSILMSGLEHDPFHGRTWWVNYDTTVSEFLLCGGFSAFSSQIRRSGWSRWYCRA